MRARIGIAMALACVLALAACGDGARGAADTPAAGADATASTPAAPPPEVLPPPDMGEVEPAVDAQADATNVDDPFPEDTAGGGATDDAPVDAAAAAAPAAPARAIAVGEPNPGAPGVVDASCRTDADCAIKDVGSCCGYRPQCVNQASPTFPKQVQAQCAKDGRVGICGFPAISGCQCVAGQCQGTGDAPGARVQ